MSESIVVTGFGPFRNHTINASWESVRLLPDEIDGINIIKVNIPVEYCEVKTQVPHLWNKYNPLFVMHVGVSGEAKKVTIEKCANRDGYKACDAKGQLHATGRACEQGEECIFTGIDVGDMCKKLNNSGTVEACISTNAGRYLCEFIYYTSLNIDPQRTLFVHVPPLDCPYSAKELANGLLEIIQCALGQCADREKMLNTVQCQCVS